MRGTGGHPEIETAAWEILGAGLRGDPSPLDSATRTWTANAAAEILRRVQDNPDVSDNTFLAKLERQLDGAPRGTVLLAAELLYLQCGPLWNLKADTKRNLVNTVLSWADPPDTLHDGLNTALDHGYVFNGAQGFTSGRRHQFNWLCRLVETWTALPEATRTAALLDPWEFGRTLRLTPKDSAGIRCSLQYLAWPGYYEHIVSKTHKRAIRDTYAHAIDGASGNDEESIDKDLHAIRGVLDTDPTIQIDWYASPYLEQWQPTSDDAQRAWLVRPGTEGGAPLVKRWENEGFVSLAATYLSALPAESTHAQVRAAVDAGYQNADYQRREELTADYHAFLARMKPGDLLVTRIEDTLHLGTILGEPETVGEPGARLRRAAQWAADPVPATDLVAPLPTLLEQQGSVVDLTDAVELLTGYLGDANTIEDGEPSPPQLAPIPPAPIRFPPAGGDLVRRTHMDRGHLQEFLDLLESRRQIVLYGPPGTGKTFLARALADHIVGTAGGSRRQLVQFHPSYAYEDFFEGFRPDPDTAGFTLQAGPLRRIASQATTPENSGAAFVLIIDEMNRANLAKVFGELYFLLEYRGESVRPQYSPDSPFRLPPNLFIIGTMNTSDRSITLVDAAIRRRFAFVELHPDEPPVRGVLENYLEANGKDHHLARLLAELNSRIDDTDRDLRIGPSYLMKPDANTDVGLERIWRYDLLPLLEEHHYGRMSRIAIRERFGLDAVSSALQPEPAPATEPDESEA